MADTTEATAQDAAPATTTPVAPAAPIVIDPGMTVRVHQRIKDVTKDGKERERIQIFEGVVLARHGGKESGATMTVRKVSEGIGVERIFPLALPTIEKIEIVSRGLVRRAKLFHLRNPRKKLKEKVMKK